MGGSIQVHFWIIALCAALIPRGFLCKEDIPVAGVSRPNYGVDFNFLYAVNNMHGSWKHIWTVDLALLDRRLESDISIQCDAIDPMCKPAQHLLDILQPLLWNATSWMHDQFAWAKDPTILATMNRFDLRRRSKRALLPFIGDIEKFFFGTATESDVNALKTTLEDMEKLHGKTIDQVSQLGENLASLTKITNEQVQNTKAGFQLVKDSLQNMTQQINTRFHQMLNDLKKEEFIVKYNSMAVAHTWALLENILPRLVDVTKLMIADSQLINGIQTILQGYIPISLIPPQELKKGLQTAMEGVNKEFPSARLSHPTTALGYYYTHKIVTPYFNGDSVSIIVDIPVDLGQDILYVYAIRTFPVAILPYNPYSHQVDPASRMSRAQARLNLKENYMIVAADGKSWSSATDAEVASCTGESIRVCKHQFALYTFSNTLCLERLWNNVEFELILDACPYQLSHAGSSHMNSIHIQVTPLSNGRWYIESPLNEQWTISCPSRPPEKRSSCTSCVIQVDCGCGVESKYFRIPTRVSSCESVFSPLHKNFTLNPFNYQPKGNPWVVNLTGDQSLSYPPRMTPDIRLPDGGSWDDVIENMDSRTFDLNKLYEKQENASRMFKTEAEALLQKIKNQDKLLATLSGWPDWVLGLMVILTFGNTAVLVLLCCMIISRARARSLGEELDIVESLEWTVLDLEVAQFVLTGLCFVLLLILSWPVMSNWIRNNEVYRRLRGYSIRIKANSFRNHRRFQRIFLHGNAHFCQDGKTAERVTPITCLLASVPPGTHLGPIPVPLTAFVTLEGNSYSLKLSTPVSLIYADENHKECGEVNFFFEYVHRKTHVPLSSRWVKLVGCRMWVE